MTLMPYRGYRAAVLAEEIRPSGRPAHALRAKLETAARAADRITSR